MLRYLETIVEFLDHQGIDRDIENSLLGAPGERPFLFYILTLIQRIKKLELGPHQTYLQHFSSPILSPYYKLRY
jgi:hypothetical protein